MSADQDKVEGKAKELGGKLTGDEDLESEGRRQHAAGKTKEALDDLEDKARGALDAVKDKLSEHREQK